MVISSGAAQQLPGERGSSQLQVGGDDALKCPG